MRSEPRWISPDLVVTIDREVVAQTGEPHVLLNGGLLISAVERPRNYWHYGEDDMVTLAAMLLLGIGQNHPFEQGNKRSALLAALVFLETNGYTLEIDDPIYLANLIRWAIDKSVTQTEFIRVLRTFVVSRP